MTNQWQKVVRFTVVVTVCFGVGMGVGLAFDSKLVAVSVFTVLWIGASWWWILRGGDGHPVFQDPLYRWLFGIGMSVMIAGLGLRLLGRGTSLEWAVFVPGFALATTARLRSRRQI